MIYGVCIPYIDIEIQTAILFVTDEIYSVLPFFCNAWTTFMTSVYYEFLLDLLQQGWKCKWICNCLWHHTEKHMCNILSGNCNAKIYPPSISHDAGPSRLLDMVVSLSKPTIVTVQNSQHQSASRQYPSEIFWNARHEH